MDRLRRRPRLRIGLLGDFRMRKSLQAGVLALTLMALPAQAEIYGAFSINGNDTGGIIPWSPQIAHQYHDLATHHCAGYKKVARITSVHARYGDYVTFKCFFPRGYDPMKTQWGPGMLNPPWGFLY
jgi:hypothetical protein